MRIEGDRIKRTRLIQSEKFIVALEVEMVIPPDDPSEPCYESETVKLLKEAKEIFDRLGTMHEPAKVAKELAALPS